MNSATVLVEWPMVKNALVAGSIVKVADSRRRLVLQAHLICPLLVSHSIDLKSTITNPGPPGGFAK